MFQDFPNKYLNFSSDLTFKYFSKSARLWDNCGLKIHQTVDQTHMLHTGHVFGYFYTLDNGKRGHKFDATVIKVKTKESHPAQLLAKESILIDSNVNTVNLTKGLPHSAFANLIR